jgi:iron complex transport system ATP-binding protein
VARCLCQTTPILLLDEPTSFFDLRHEHLLLELLRERCATEKLAVMLVLHNVRLALQYSHDILLLNDGHILYAGPAEDLNDGKLLSETFGLPAEKIWGSVIPQKPGEQDGKTSQ